MSSKRKMFAGPALCCLIALVAPAMEARAQEAANARVNINYLNRLGPAAVEAIDVALDREVLQVLSASVAADGADQEKLKRSLAKLQGVYIKGFKFSAPGKYSAADLDELRSQLRAPGWQRVADIRSKRSGDNAELYLKLQGDRLGGMTIISADPAELFVINIVGDFDIERLSFEEGIRGLSRVNAELNAWNGKRRKNWRR